MPTEGSKWDAIWRNPPEETLGLYPGLVVADDRVSGSITLGQTRLPLWAIPVAFLEWEEYADGEEGVTQTQAADFVHDLLELRGEFGRLLLVLANGERLERRSGPYDPWWERPRARQRVVAQLKRCLSALEEPSHAH